MEKGKEKVSAYLTVYLALVMSVLLSLCLVLIEGARSNAIRLESECVVDIALNSVLAEYHRELFRRYNLFAIDSSYGTPHASIDNTEWHLRQYIERNLSIEDIFLSDFLYKDFLAMELEEKAGIEMTKVSILTDGNGAVFRRCAVEAIKDDVGVALLEELVNWTDIVKSEGLQEQNVAAQMQQADAEIQAYDGKEVQISEKEWITIDVTNPTEALNRIRRKGILDTVISNPEEISSKGISEEQLIAERMKCGNYNCGNVFVQKLSGEEQLLERFLFQEYLLRYMGRYGQEKEDAALDYQMEYLIAGNENDLENLKSVANTLCALREAANVMYLFADEEKCLEAEVLATVLTTLFQIPEAASLFKYALLLGWSYAESLYDVEVLLAGGSIPLMKTDATWHYNLDGALAVHNYQGQQLPQEGISYADYLRIFMMFTDLDELTGRAMNMVEADIRLTVGNESFRLDGCYDGIEACMRIESAYGYECEIVRGKFYSLY